MQKTDNVSALAARASPYLLVEAFTMNWQHPALCTRRMWIQHIHLCHPVRKHGSLIVKIAVSFTGQMQR